MGATGSKASPPSATVAVTDAAAAGGWADDGDVDAGQRRRADASLSADVSTPEEDALKRRLYAGLRSPYAARRGAAATNNLIERIYNEDFETIDHVQALRLPPMVTQQLRSTVRDEAERRCTEPEKTMARCLQDKMWTSWKCQKERDVYYHCVADTEQRNLRPDPERPEWVDVLTALRWKYNLGVFHGEIIGRNNIMREVWREHHPDRELPHPWVRDA
ncbi:hypothetical protein NESM_000209400 [Novymonas esmeraldas]|uniref:NADH dehydrogenase [ubiquinone] 1 beta subcomplex subunit 7 n=1 Tax=Novymonas esmeraldas TaxID=1808958 RepID=A0AAW0F900_9TRYP